MRGKGLQQLGKTTLIHPDRSDEDGWPGHAPILCDLPTLDFKSAAT